MKIELHKNNSDSFKRYKNYHREYLRHLRLLDADWPAAGMIIKKIVNHISDMFVENDQPAVYQFVNMTLKDYVGNIDLSDPKRFQRVVNQFVNQVVDRFYYLVVVDLPSGETWRVTSHVNFEEWIRLQVNNHSEGLFVSWVNQDKTAFKEQIIKRFVCNDYLKLVDNK